MSIEKLGHVLEQKCDPKNVRAFQSHIVEIQATDQSNESNRSGHAIGIDRDLGAQRSSAIVRMVTERVADSVFRREDEELVVGHLQTELLADVVVVHGGLVARAAGTVEVFACVDTRRRRVAAVLARERVAGAADGSRRGVAVSDGGRCHQMGGNKKERRGQEEGLHVG